MMTSKSHAAHRFRPRSLMFMHHCQSRPVEFLGEQQPDSANFQLKAVRPAERRTLQKITLHLV